MVREMTRINATLLFRRRYFAIDSTYESIEYGILLRIFIKKKKFGTLQNMLFKFINNIME